MVELPYHPKVDMGEPVFNYAVAYYTHNQEPLFYEKYPGSLNDISQLQFMLDKASGYGYKKIGFILDRGYFSCENIQYMDKRGRFCYSRAPLCLFSFLMKFGNPYMLIIIEVSILSRCSRYIFSKSGEKPAVFILFSFRLTGMNRGIARRAKRKRRAGRR